MPLTYYPATYQPMQGYAPYYIPQVPQIQPQSFSQGPTQMQTQPAVTQANTPTMSGMLWVADEREASLYPVAPNTAVALWDSHKPIVYVKQSDASGKPVLKVYDLAERTETSQETQKETAVNLDTFATKSELAAVVSAVKDVSGVLSSLRGDVDTMKGDVYGLAGKKKSVKKSTEAEDDE